MDVRSASPSTYASPSHRRWAVVLAALYLPGGPSFTRLPTRRWPAVLRCLRREDRAEHEPARCLRAAGFSLEALVLHDRVRMEWAERQVALNRVLTAASLEYPFRWLGLREGAMSAALWKVGAMPAPPFMAIVGSRSPSNEQASLADRIATEAVRAGFSIVSGGAWGVDRIAAQAAKRVSSGRVVEMLPTGISGSDDSDGIARLSLFEPEAEFSTARAMARNHAIYSLAEAAFVIGPRFREGGTWHGCVSALRARLTRVFVLETGSKRATTALAAMGATLVPASTSFAEALARPRSPMQPSWFVGEPGRDRSDRPARFAIAQVHC